MKRKILLPLALTLTITTGTACYGKFAATRWLYDFNGTLTSSKFVHSIVLWVLILLPAYSLATTVDFLILNVIEFWTGNNLLAEHLNDGDSRLVQAEMKQEADGSVTVTKGDQSFRVVPLDAQRVAVYQGELLLGVTEQQADGSLAMYDGEGKLLRTISAEQISQVEQQPELATLARVR
jgi:hypothetical protein